MVQLPLLNSRVMSSTFGSSFSTLMFCLPSFLPTNWSAKPNFLANRYMMVWSGLDSNIGSMTFSRHCTERLDAVTEPEVSSWVAAGSRYTARSAFGCLPASFSTFIPCSSSGIAAIAAVADEQRSEEHTSELQSPCNLVCRLLLEKKKQQRNHSHC